MRACFRNGATLVVVPENQTERYALEKWFEGYTSEEPTAETLSILEMELPDNASEYAKSKNCANCSKLYQCIDVRKHPEWHCKKHDFA